MHHAVHAIVIPEGAGLLSPAPLVADCLMYNVHLLWFYYKYIHIYTSVTLYKSVTPRKADFRRPASSGKKKIIIVLHVTFHCSRELVMCSNCSEQPESAVKGV